MNENRMKNPNYKYLEPLKEDIIGCYIINNYNTQKTANIFSLKVGVLKNRIRKWGFDSKKSWAGNKNSNWTGYKDIPGSFIYCAKIGAKRRNIEFSITIEEIWQIFIKQNKYCELSGQKLIFDSYSKAYDGNVSLDRIDSSKGYTKDNCQLITKRANIAKQDMLNQELIELANEITEYNKEERYKDIL